MLLRASADAGRLAGRRFDSGSPEKQIGRETRAGANYFCFKRDDGFICKYLKFTNVVSVKIITRLL